MNTVKGIGPGTKFTYFGRECICLHYIDSGSRTEGQMIYEYADEACVIRRGSVAEFDFAVFRSAIEVLGPEYVEPPCLPWLDRPLPEKLGDVGLVILALNFFGVFAALVLMADGVIPDDIHPAWFMLGIFVAAPLLIAAGVLTSRSAQEPAACA